MTTVNHVDATFGGEQVRFRLGPKAIGLFESVAGSARATLSRLVSSNWKVADVISVLTWSHPASFAAAQTVDRIVHRRPGVYAALATTVLAAALSGLPEAAATFDENEEDTE